MAVKPPYIYIGTDFKLLVCQLSFKNDIGLVERLDKNRILEADFFLAVQLI
jgi:hypothetical protein